MAAAAAAAAAFLNPNPHSPLPSPFPLLFATKKWRGERHGHHGGMWRDEEGRESATPPPRGERDQEFRNPVAAAAATATAAGVAGAS